MNVSSNEEHTEGGGQPNRAFTPARIVALVVIGVVVLALGYIHVSSGDNSVSVPSGAKAGDLILHDCDYATEDGSYAADCGTLVVPENRHKAGSRLIALPVTRIRARSADPAEPIFRLQGGPGITNTAFTAASRYAEKHDVVLVGYRGVDGSSRLDCPEVTSAREQARGYLTEKAMRADAAAYRLAIGKVMFVIPGPPWRRKIGSAGSADRARMRVTGTAIRREPAVCLFSGTTSAPQSAA